ncbi:hypothetical protein M0534_08505 [Methylonatrum kenyense]|uniref:hypothetical protein n=1 Tax=Methylonatrum kenyense TaxID=455253 RepID=UPI0020C0401F|nr:hypothetical protein [Methylonatrum kenyense]MCK8516365.1 hypothetical protein [Methylonatrum kenyense]
MRYLFAHIHRCFGLLVLFGVCGSALAANSCPGSPIGPDDGTASLEQQVHAVSQAAHDAAQALPREDFDPAALQTSLGSAPETLFAWVRDETRWLAYDGELRGAQGVVMDRMGSSLDRALLLADLLRRAGHTARIVGSEIETEQATALAARWLDVPIPLEPQTSAELTQQDAGIQATAERFDLDPAEFSMDIRRELERFEASGSELAKAVSVQQGALEQFLDGDVAAGSAPVTHHWWVQIDQGGHWQDLDPALPDLAAGERWLDEAHQTAFYPEDIPEDQRHWLELAIIAEQLVGDRLRQHTALTHRFPVSELIGKQIRIETYPFNVPGMAAVLGVDGDFDQAGLPSAVLQETEWMPLLRIGGDLVSDKSILSDGTVQEQRGLAPHGEAFDEATGALGELSLRGREREDEAPPAELSAVLLQLAVHTPNRDVDHFERPMMDVIGAAARHGDSHLPRFNQARRDARATAMLGSMELAPQVAWMPAEQLSALRYGELLDNRLPAVGAAYAAVRDGLDFLDQALDERQPRRSELDQLARLRQVLSPERENIALDRVNLLGFARLLSLDGDGEPAVREGLDIIDNRVAVPAASDDAAMVRIAQGVTDTLLEARLIAGDTPTAANTAVAFARDLDRQSPWTAQSADAVFEGTGQKEDLRATLALAGEDQLIIAPAETDGEPVWWQLNPQTGDLLGFGPDARGQYVEGILLLIEQMETAVDVVGMVQTVWACMFQFDYAEGMSCCVKSAAVNSAVSSYMSNGLSSYAELSGFVITGGNKLFDMLNSMAVGKLAGKATDSFLDAVTPASQC